MAYTPKILTDPDDLDAIRALVGLDVTKPTDVAKLPDTTLLSVAYLPAKEAAAIKEFTNYASLTGPDKDLLRSVVAKTVAIVAISNLLESETSLEYKYTRKLEKQAELLRAEIKDEMEMITPTSDDAAAPEFFRLVGPTRTAKAAE